MRDEHDSESEIELDGDGEEESPPEQEEIMDVGGNFCFFIGKDGDTLCASETVAGVTRTKAKNVVKIFLGPKGTARQCS